MNLYRLALPILGLAIAPSALAQSLIIPTQETRIVQCRVGAQTDTDAGVPGVPFQSFVAISNGDMAGASQDSSIGDSSMSFAGTQSASSTIGGAVWGESVFDVSFQLTAKSEYSFAGTYEGYDYGYAEVYLFRGTSDYLAGELGVVAGAFSFHYVGVLDPGEYRVLARVYGGGGYASAAIDMNVDLTALSGSYCPASPNSTGNAAQLSFSGTQDLAANDFVLEGNDAPPGAFSLFVYSATQAAVPLGDGTLCIGQPFQRLNTPVQVDPNGAVTLPLDFTVAPLGSGPGAITAGSTWNFQWIYRDSVGAGLNASNGLMVTFCP